MDLVVSRPPRRPTGVCPSVQMGPAFFFLMGCLMIGILFPWRPLHAEEPERSPVARLIHALVRGRQADRQFTCQGELICGIALIPEFYAGRNFEPVWSTPQGPTHDALVLINVISRVEEDGLFPQDYHFKRLQDMALTLEARPPAAMPAALQMRAEFDLLMTDAAFLVGAHMLGGRVNPETIHGSWSAFSHKADLIGLLNDALRERQVARLVQGLHPAHVGYIGLRRALAEYRRMAAEGGWPRLEEGPVLRYADDHPGVAQLRRRLAASDDLASAHVLQPTFFDAGLEAAVKAFQHRHGIAVDGVVGRETREALNVPLAQRIEQLLINMERWRWIPGDLGLRYLSVNIADFMLTMVDEGRVRGTMRVVVGRTYRKTPVFSGTMTYLELHPYWNIPRRNAVEDILPRIRKDPGYIDQQGIRIFSGWSDDAVLLAAHEVDWAALDRLHFPIRLQQAPGPLNALGRIKFMFPNKHAVYLHDTPRKDHFNHVSRGFSSGCIRVEDPAGLAAFVLEGTAGWDPETIDKNLNTGQRRVVMLKQPIPVHLLYWTAWSDDSGTVFFRKDIYKRDAAVMRALKEKPNPREWVPGKALPGTHLTDVDVDKIGFGIIADPAP